MIKQLFIPSEKNNFHPQLLRKSALLFYIAIILLANIALTKFNLVTVQAAITVNELLEMHNKQREIYNIPNVVLNQELSYSATAKAQAMLASDCWSHYCPNGKSPWDFFDEAGYIYQYAGENLAEGFKNTDAVIAAWLNSPTHRENMLNANFNEIGFGIATGRFQGKDNNMIVVVHFGARLNGPIQAIDGLTPISFPVQDNIPLLSDTYITVSNPQHNSSINGSTLNVEGIIKPEDLFVRVHINGQDSGTVSAEGENYTFRSQPLADGIYTVKTDLLNTTGEPIAHSSDIVVRIDGADPKLIDDKIITLYNPETDTFTINIQVSEDTAKAFLNNLQFIKQEMYWSVSMNESFVRNAESLTIELSDSFNNTHEIELNKISLLQKALIYESNYSALSVKGASTYFESSNIRMILSIAFITYLFILLLIDFAVLAKTDMLQVINRKTHLHIATIIILLLILNVGAVTGTVLTGLKL